MKRILIVDDDLEIGETLQLILEETYEVTLVVNGEQALRALEASSFDAMVLDLMMPVMDGATLVGHMQQRSLTLPVIAVSAHPDVRAVAIRLGIADHLMKPFRLKDLEHKLERVTGPGGGTGGGSPGSGGSSRGGGGGAREGCTFSRTPWGPDPRSAAKAA